MLDYDNDGFDDIFFINGAAIPSLRKTDASYWNRLYRNNGNNTFTDVTEKAGVAGEGYSMAVAAGGIAEPRNRRYSQSWLGAHYEGT